MEGRYAWKMDGIFDCDANDVMSELERLGDHYTLKDVVDLARDENTALHKCFEWDDAIAAEKYRESQAGTVIRMIVYVDQKTEEKTNIRAVVTTDIRKEYSPTRLVMRNKSEYEALLDRAMNELRAFKAKYSMLKELDYILELID